jgi:O-antigen/teichoic acid export membrane protein
MNGAAGGDLTRNTLSGLLWTAWGAGAHAVLQLVVLVVLARLLSPAQFGVVSAALIVINFSRILYQFGLGPALVQLPRLEARHVGTAFTASVAFGLLLGVCIWATAPVAAKVLRIEAAGPTLRALAWMFPLLGIGLVPESLLVRDLRFRWLANADVATFAVGYGAVGVALAALGWGAWALVVAHLAQSLLRTVVLLVARPPSASAPWFERRAFNELLYFGGGHTVARIANFVAHHGDTLVVGRWLGPAALGLYGRAYQLMATPASLFAGVLDKVLFPVMATVQRDAGRLASLYTRGLAVIALVVLPPCALLVVLAPEVVTLALGPQWMGAVVPLQILAAGMLFRTSEKMSDSLARAVGAVYRRAWRQVLYAALVVAGAWVGLRWGIGGAAAGVLVALGVNFALMAQLSLRVIGLGWRPFIAVHQPPLYLTALVGIVATAAAAWSRARGMPPAITVAGSTVAALSSGVAVAWRWPRRFVGAEGLWMLRVLRGRLSARRPGPATATSSVLTVEASSP